MAADEVVVPRVYLKHAALWHSAHHRAMAPAPGSPSAQPGADQPMVLLEFYNGVAGVEQADGQWRPCSVPINIYRIFADLGIATTERPLTRYEQWERDNQMR